MTSLFTPFDDFIYSLSFIIFFIFFIFSLNKSLYLFSMEKSLKIHICGFMGTFFSSLNNSNYSKTYSFLMSIMLIFLFYFNFFSIFPFIFPFTSHPKMVMTLSLGIWLSIILFSLTKNSGGLMSHLVPEGSPLVLSFFLFLIEVVSSLIRPMTLSIRLFANIMTGHILIVLLTYLIMKFSFCLPVLFILSLLEMAVAFIQAHIMVTLLSLYFSEI